MDSPIFENRIQVLYLNPEVFYLHKMMDSAMVQLPFIFNFVSFKIGISPYSPFFSDRLSISWKAPLQPPYTATLLLLKSRPFTFKTNASLV